MHNRSSLWFFLIPLTLLLAACRAEPTSLLAQEPSFSLPVQAMESVECPFETSQEMDVTCGVVKVQDEKAGLMEEIDLQVMIFHSPSEQPEPDPLVIMGFDPGAARFFLSRGLFESFIEKRDVVIYSRQPISESEESSEIECPEIIESQLAFLQQLQNRAGYMGEMLKTYQICHDRLAAANIDLSGVSADQTARDVLAVRQALEVEQINLYGANYSSLPAIKVMELDPDGLRSVVLMSFYPPMTALDLENSTYFAFQKLFQDCAADEACQAAYPDLETKFRAVVDQLNTNPLTLEMKHPDTPDMLQLYIDGERLVTILRDLLSDDDTTARIPFLIEEIYSGRGYKIAQEVQSWMMMLTFQGQEMMTVSKCTDRWAANSIVSSGSQSKYPLVQQISQTEFSQIFQTCSIWVGQEFQPQTVQATSSNVPLLVLHGDYNTVYGPDLVEGWLRGFRQTQLVVLAGRGTGIFGGGTCAGEIVAGFLENPDRRVDDSCAQDNPFEFVLPLE